MGGCISSDEEILGHLRDMESPCRQSSARTPFPKWLDVQFLHWHWRHRVLIVQHVRLPAGRRSTERGSERCSSVLRLLPVVGGRRLGGGTKDPPGIYQRDRDTEFLRQRRPRDELF